MTRRRYIYREVAPGEIVAIEISDDHQLTERRAPVATEELVYGKAGAVATGEDISTKRKFREYMKREGVAHASDYSAQHYEKRQAERAKLFTPGSGFDSERRKKAIVESVHRLEAQKGRRR